MPRIMTAVLAMQMVWPAVLHAAPPAPQSTIDATEPSKALLSIESPPTPGNEKSADVPSESTGAPMRQYCRQLSANLMAQSRDAFDRGLMSLPDYADRLEAAVTLHHRVANSGSADASEKRALVMQAAALNDAFARLKNFKQPASKGWKADVAYAQLLAARSNDALNAPPEKSQQARDRQIQIETLARQQFELRQADYSVGLAGLPEMSRAASQLALPASGPSKPNDGDRKRDIALLTQYRGRLETIVSTTSSLSKQGAGLGRNDAVDLARFELARANGLIAAAQGDAKRAAGEFASADRAAEQAFTAQRQYYDSGTAGLGDLISTWRNRDVLHHQMSVAGMKQPATTVHDTNLADLGRLADQTADRRGRNAADVTMVKSLMAIHGLEQSQSKPTANAQAGPNTR